MSESVETKTLYVAIGEGRAALRFAPECRVCESVRVFRGEWQLVIGLDPKKFDEFFGAVEVK